MDLSGRLLKFFQTFKNKKLETNQRIKPRHFLPMWPSPSQVWLFKSILNALLGGSHSITGPHLMWHDWCPAMPTCKASWGTPAHTRDVPLISAGSWQLPEGFCSKEKHKAIPSPSYGLWTEFSWEEKAKIRMSTVPPPHYLVARKLNFLTVKGEGWKSYVTNLWQEHLQPHKNMESCGKEGKTERTKAFFKHFSFLSAPPTPAPLSWALQSRLLKHSSSICCPSWRWELQLKPGLVKPTHPAPQPHTGAVINFCTRSDVLAWQP